MVVNKKPTMKVGLCDRERIRTFDRLLRRQMLYPAELRDQYFRVCKSKHIYNREKYYLIFF